MSEKDHCLAVPSTGQLFYAGHYAEILRLRVDGVHEEGPAADLPFVVGALAFSGRLEEARALFSSRLRRGAAPPAATLVAARFFLGVAYCRAGRIDEAKRELACNAREAGRHAGPLARFYVLQGLGCIRYFTGRLRQAARHALGALQYAFSADFPYGRLLATDLRGHVLVQLGAIREGLSLLGTARKLAGALSLPGNAAALDCAIAIYRSRFGVVRVQEAIAELSGKLVDARPEDSYSRRTLCIELAVQHALAGEGDAAWEMLERLRNEQLPDGGDTRARIRFLLACANVARLRHGRSGMQPFVREARALVAAHEDITLEIDVCCMEILAAESPGERASIRARLDALHHRSGVARVWLRPDREGAPGAALLEEDRLGALYAACLDGSSELASHVISSGHWGLLPLCLKLDPGRRLLLVGRRVVVEEHGNVLVSSDVPDGALRFLRALSSSRRLAKEELLRVVWGIGVYRPDAHDPVIRTAVSRLRALLGARGHWIEAASGCYQIKAGIEVLDVTGALDEPPPPAATDPDAIVAFLSRQGPASSTDVASHLGVSEITALRRLRELVEPGVVQRTGKGKNTRYHVESRGPGRRDGSRPPAEEP